MSASVQKENNGLGSVGRSPDSVKKVDETTDALHAEAIVTTIEGINKGVASL